MSDLCGNVISLFHCHVTVDMLVRAVGSGTAGTASVGFNIIN